MVGGDSPVPIVEVTHAGALGLGEIDEFPPELIGAIAAALRDREVRVVIAEGIVTVSADLVLLARPTRDTVRNRTHAGIQGGDAGDGATAASRLPSSDLTHQNPPRVSDRWRIRHFRA